MNIHEIPLNYKLDCLPMVWHALSPTTVSFYRSEHGVCNFNNIIRQRMRDILLSNPWLAGRLVTSSSTKVPCINYAIERAEVEFRLGSQFFTCTEESFFLPNLSYNDLSAKLNRFRVPPGCECCDNDQQVLFRVVLIESTNQEQFALFASLSHIIGDALSFYRIMAMLDVNNPIEALSLDRDVMSAIELMDYHAGYSRSWYIAESPYFEAGFQSNMQCNLKTSVSVFQCQNEEIEKLKSTIPTQNITTNDVLTSWLGGQLDSDFLTITMNMRSLLVNDQDASSRVGNYFRYLLLCRGEYEQPQQVRDIIKHAKAGIGNDEKYSKLPSVWQSIRQRGYVSITNWVSLYQPINFPDCTMIRHLPVYDPQFSFHFTIIFRLRDDATGVLLFSHHSILNCLKQKDSIIQEYVW